MWKRKGTTTSIPVIHFVDYTARAMIRLQERAVGVWKILRKIKTEHGNRWRKEDQERCLVEKKKNGS